jgi:hypothetical protein
MDKFPSPFLSSMITSGWSAAFTLAVNATLLLLKLAKGKEFCGIFRLVG